MKVSETLGYAVSTKVPRLTPGGSNSNVSYINEQNEKILSSLGISHTAETVVGDEFIRGVSGGERKRVSLAEVMATEAAIQCWDNSTRGLDASNALDFAKLLRRLADDDNKAIVATLYQAGNGIYSQFDKVLVLAEGREIYYGPASKAKSYFEDMGFRCTPGANTADFLTSVAVLTEREIIPGHEDAVPNTAQEFEAAYKRSKIRADMINEINSHSPDSLGVEIDHLSASWESDKNRSMAKLSRTESPYHVSFAKQVFACTTRFVTEAYTLF